MQGLRDCTMRVALAAVLVAMLPLASSFQSPSSLGLGWRLGGAHRVLGYTGLSPRRSSPMPLPSMSLLDGANLILADAKMSLEEAVAGKAAEKAAAAAAAASAASTAGAVTTGYQEGIVPKVPLTPTLMEQIMGGDDLVLTLMASITLLLGVVVTVGAVYLTVVNYQEEQYKEKLSDASSAEYREMAKEIMALEAETKGAVSSKGRAMKEALSMDKESNKNTKGSANALLAEPGNREDRRYRAKRQRKEESKKQQQERMAKAKGVTESGLSSMPGSENKGFFDGLMDNFK